MSKPSIVIEHKEVVFWKNVKELTEMDVSKTNIEINKQKALLQELEKSLKFQKGIVEHADYKIQKHQE